MYIIVLCNIGRGDTFKVVCAADQCYRTPKPSSERKDVCTVVWHQSNGWV